MIIIYNFVQIIIMTLKGLIAQRKLIIKEKYMEKLLLNNIKNYGSHLTNNHISFLMELFNHILSKVISEQEH